MGESVGKLVTPRKTGSTDWLSLSLTTGTHANLVLAAWFLLALMGEGLLT
jgi:hypothetical protein